MEQTARQVQPLESMPLTRLGAPGGSATSFSGVLWGLRYFGIDVPVLGVKVGADPYKRLQKYAPFGWEDQAALVEAEVPYHTYIKDNQLTTGLVLDPIYEAKTFPYLQEGDLLWTVGIRKGLEQPAFPDLVV